MALGIVLPAWAAGLLAVLIYAAVADLSVASAAVVFFGASGAAFLVLATIAAVCRPMRPVEGEGSPAPRTRRIGKGVSRPGTHPARGLIRLGI